MRVKQMLQYINEHYWEDFTVKDIVEYAGSLRENTEKFLYKFFEFPHNNSKAKT